MGWMQARYLEEPHFVFPLTTEIARACHHRHFTASQLDPMSEFGLHSTANSIVQSVADAYVVQLMLDYDKILSVQGRIELTAPRGVSPRDLFYSRIMLCARGSIMPCDPHRRGIEFHASEDEEWPEENPKRHKRVYTFC